MNLLLPVLFKFRTFIGAIIRIMANRITPHLHRTGSRFNCSQPRSLASSRNLSYDVLKGVNVILGGRGNNRSKMDVPRHHAVSPHKVGDLSI